MSSEGEDICGNCDKKLPKLGDHAVCKRCSIGFHFGYCSVKSQTWKSMNKVMQESWNCQLCRKSKKRNDYVASNPTTEDLSNITTKDSVKEVECLKKKAQDRDQDVLRLESDIAELDQYGRRCNLEIHSLECNGNTRNENVAETVRKLAESIEVPYDKIIIHRAHRLQHRRDGKPPTPLIQFFSKEDRDTWLKAGKIKKTRGVYFNENLCPFYRNLLRDTKRN
ncbi:hypothetical protein J6590_007885 [Homalodisca vitripennis]|nr:hypothetical protein J6590_007885 [Homalodisca vitripennis]